MIVNRSDLGKIFGKAPVTIDEFVSEGMPYKARPKKGERGEWRFDSAECVEWYAKRGKMQSGNGKALESITLRTAEAEAVVKELKAADALKTTIGIQDVEALFEEQLGIVKSRVTAIPARVAQAVAVETDPAICLRIVKAEIDEALESISTYDVPDPEEPAAIEPPTDEEEPAAAPAVDPEGLDYDGY